MTQFSLTNFNRFCSALRVDTKEKGMITLSPESQMGTQTYVMQEIAKGLEAGKHYHVILKGRQLGITTISLALDLYWHFKHAGMSGTLVTHDEESRNMFKTTLSMYIAGLPKQYRVPVENHNRTELVFKNRSRIAYQVAGTRKKGSLGRGKAITFMHSTETSSYGDQEGLASLEASLAQSNPNRLFVFETTARGYNQFYDMWDTATRASTQNAIFVCWWRNQFYSALPGSNLYEVYWDGRLTPDEREWARQVKLEYGYEIKPAQIAWWRYTVNEIIKDETLSLQEFPWTPELAFVQSGSNFFSASRLSDEMRVAQKYKGVHHRFVIRNHFEDCEVIASKPAVSNLVIWDTPVHGAYYVIGADPAYGSSEWADRFCCSVYRCYADGLEQVAEFATADCSTYSFAWVIAYLAGAYKGALVNLEVNGPGQAVWQEMLNLKRLAASGTSKFGPGLYDVLSNIQSYLYKRLDSFGAPNAYMWKTTTDTKERMMNIYKDMFERGMLIVKSKDALDEMKNVTRDDGFLGAPGRGKDDRVIAGALAAVAWADQLRMRLVQGGITRANKDGNASQQGNNVLSYLKNIGISK